MNRVVIWLQQTRETHMAKQYRRIGEEKKCPACGWRLDAEAYRCPKCFIYFCYKCRARVTKGDPQYQCADQSCECYGKLLCSACTVMIEERRDENRSRTKTTGDNWGFAWLIAIAISGIAAWIYFGQFWVGATVAVVVGVVGAILLSKAGSTFFTNEETEQYSVNVKVADHRCCIQCKHPVKNLT